MEFFINRLYYFLSSFSASASGRSSPHTSGTSTPVTSVTRSYPAKAATSATTKAVVDEASVDVQDLLEDLLHRLTHKARSGTKTPVAPIAVLLYRSFRTFSHTLLIL
jgi:hypothetical protein